MAPRWPTALRLEIGDAHAVAVGEDMDIAGLERLKLGLAGGEIGRADLGPRQALNDPCCSRH